MHANFDYIAVNITSFRYGKNKHKMNIGFEALHKRCQHNNTLLAAELRGYLFVNLDLAAVLERFLNVCLTQTNSHVRLEY